MKSLIYYISFLIYIILPLTVEGQPKELDTIPIYSAEMNTYMYNERFHLIHKQIKTLIEAKKINSYYDDFTSIINKESFASFYIDTSYITKPDGVSTQTIILNKLNSTEYYLLKKKKIGYFISPDFLTIQNSTNSPSRMWIRVDDLKNLLITDSSIQNSALTPHENFMSTSDFEYLNNMFKGKTTALKRFKLSVTNSSNNINESIVKGGIYDFTIAQKIKNSIIKNKQPSYNILATCWQQYIPFTECTKFTEGEAKDYFFSTVEIFDIEEDKLKMIIEEREWFDNLVLYVLNESNKNNQIIGIGVSYKGYTRGYSTIRNIESPTLLFNNFRNELTKNEITFLKKAIE